MILNINQLKSDTEIEAAPELITAVTEVLYSVLCYSVLFSVTSYYFYYISEEDFVLFTALHFIFSYFQKLKTYNDFVNYNVLLYSEINYPQIQNNVSVSSTSTRYNIKMLPVK